MERTSKRKKRVQRERKKSEVRREERQNHNKVRLIEQHCGRDHSLHRGKEACSPASRARGERQQGVDEKRDNRESPRCKRGSDERMNHPLRL